MKGERCFTIKKQKARGSVKFKKIIASVREWQDLEHWVGEIGGLNTTKKKKRGKSSRFKKL